MLKRLTTLGTLAFGCAGLAVVMTGSSTAAEQGAAALTIRSSLDGKTVLPHRIRWIAYPSAPVRFPGVEFLIDDKVVVSNRLPPFAFGDDGRDEATGEVNTGYLVTTWLSPGKHRFTIRAKGTGANRGTTATRTVVARVPAAPARPRQLLATWRRDLATAVPPDRSMLYRPTAPAGTYRFAINSRFIQISGPDPRRHVKIDYVAGPGTITIRGPVWTGDLNEGGWCEPWGPGATYSWTVSDDRLALTPSDKSDPCKQRGAVLTGDWARRK